MKNLTPLVALLAIAFAVSCKKEEPKTPDTGTPTPAGYTLVWADEFDGQTINTLNWTFETGDGTAYGLPAGWGNNEKQIYTNSLDNASLTMHEGNTVLAITARETSPGQYTSARLTTNGLKSMRYGRIHVRAKVPTGNGLWPAIWLLGDNRPLVDWPGCGEIDIAEVLGKQSNTLYNTLHYVKSGNTKGELQHAEVKSGGLYSDDYHVYGLEWTPQTVTFTLDGTNVYQVPIDADMKEFQRSFYMILNVAVGGYWPGEPDASTIFPQAMYVDYVRVYSINNLVFGPPPALDIAEETLGQPIDTNLANAAIKDSFLDFGELSITPYGAGGEPFLRASDTAIDGTHSLVYDFPGISWGGAYIQLATPKDLSTYSNLKFSIIKPAGLANAEIKLEGTSTNAIVMLGNYTGVPVANNFVEYTIPLSDFAGLNLTNLKIPFAIWNVVDANSNYVAAKIYVDNVHFSN
jgi:beta-glucanase (GH16 family)